EDFNKNKAKLLYDCIEHSHLFVLPVKDSSMRSLMNVPFLLKQEELEAVFLQEASKKGLVTLKGHRSVGGMRASIYNAMPLDGVKALVKFIEEFDAKYS
ncbi:MAG: hypothetical protein OMM_12855, partial [Candidatus Magnetoglobus multicellularis str. Araruama]